MFDCETSNFAYVNHTLSIPGTDQYYKQLENNRSIHWVWIHEWQLRGQML